MNNKIFEWTGVTTAILYSLFVVLNIGIGFIGSIIVIYLFVTITSKVLIFINNL